MLLIVLGIVVGGHILYGITNFDLLITLFKNLSKLSFKDIIYALSRVFGGMVFYGGFIGAYLLIKLYTKRSKFKNRAAFLDIFGVCVPLFHAFGRIGCFFGGCCYGIESRFGFIVTGNELVPELNGVRRLPISLIEATLNLGIFFTLLYLYKKEKFKTKLVYIYMLMYSIVRFCTEFFRGDAIRGFLGPFSTSQWVSIILLVFAATVFILQAIKRKKSYINEGL